MNATLTQTTEQSNRLVASLKDAIIAGAIAAAMTFFLVGLKTSIAPAGSGTSGLILEQRWDLVGIAVLIVFIGRFLLNYLIWNRPKTDKLEIPSFKLPTLSLPRQKTASYILVVFVFLLPFILVFTLGTSQTRPHLNLMIMIATYIMLGWGLNIVVGLAGLLDLGYVAFYAVGAYSFALLDQYFGWGFWVCLPLAGILAAFWGIILGFPVLRLRGDYLAIVTLAFGEIIRVVLINWYEFTGGPDGINNIAKPSLFGIDFDRGADGFAATFGLTYSPIHKYLYLYLIIVTLALLTNFITLRLRRLPLGRAWEALREDEIACRSLGMNTTITKLSAFSIGAMFAGFAGSFFATNQGFISPESFVFQESAIILAIVVLGGMGSQVGVVIAAILLIGGLETFREFAEYRMLIFGMAMVAIMVWKPRGLISSRNPSIVYKEQKAIGSDQVAQGEGH